MECEHSSNSSLATYPWLTLLSPSLHAYSVTKSCLILCNPMACSIPGFPVLHYLLESAQIPVYWVGDAIQPSHPLSSPSPPALSLSQHQGLFHGVSSSHCGQSIGVSASASVLPMNIQNWFPLGWTGWISFQIKGLSRVFSNTTVFVSLIYKSIITPVYWLL